MTSLRKLFLPMKEVRRRDRMVNKGNSLKRRYEISKKGRRQLVFKAEHHTTYYRGSTTAAEHARPSVSVPTFSYSYGHGSVHLEFYYLFLSNFSLKNMGTRTSLQESEEHYSICLFSAVPHELHKQRRITHPGSQPLCNCCLTAAYTAITLRRDILWTSAFIIARRRCGTLLPRVDCTPWTPCFLKASRSNLRGGEVAHRKPYNLPVS